MELSKFGYQKSTFIRQFQRSIFDNANDSKGPNYFLHGKRVTNIINTKLIHRNIFESPNCICGKKEG